MAQVTVGGFNKEVRNFNISTSISPITFEHAVNAFILQVRTSVDCRFYADDNDLSDYWTIKSGTTFSLDVGGQEKDLTVGWIRTDTGTAVLEAVGIY